MESDFLDDGASCVPVTVMEEVTDSCRIAEQAAGKETILLVEDEAFVRKVTGEVLRRAGYLVLSARDSAEAERWHEANRSEIDLLITDVILPGENGRILAEKLRKREGNLKVLFVTGYAEQIGLLNEDGVACLAKPFSSRALLESVRRVFDAKDSREVVRICREWAHVAQAR
jgi:two-component system, cell cycle sensor histidine kinase and response regulator CckA